MATGGVFAVIAGTAIAGGGTSLITSPLQKIATKECMTLKDTAIEVGLGATIGVVTGPFGKISSAAKIVGLTGKIGARMLAGSAAGATSGAISEGISAVKNQKWSWKSFLKSVAIGAVSGSVGGGSTSLAHSSVCKPVADVIGRPVMRIATQAGTAMATDASIQLATTGKIDPNLLIANAAGQVACGATAETASGIAQRTETYAKRLDERHIKEFNKNEPNESKHLTPPEIKDIKKGIAEANNLKQSQLDDLLQSKVSRKDRVMIGKQNIHGVKDQLAADFGEIPKKGFKRSPNRVLMKSHKGNFIYDGHIRDHKYREVHGKPENIRNPLRDFMRNDQIFKHLINQDEDNEAKNK